MVRNAQGGVRGRTPNTRSAKGISAAAGLLSLVVLLAACGSLESDSNESTGSDSAGTQAAVQAAAKIAAQYSAPPTKILQNTPLAKQPTEGVKSVVLTSGSPAANLASDSACQGVKSVGWECKVVSFDATNPATFQAGVQTALQEGAKFIMNDGTPPSLLGPELIKDICDSGAYFVSASVYPDETKDCITTVTDGGEARTLFATALANWFIADSDGKGNALVSTISQFPVLFWFATEFKRIVEENCPDCKVTLRKFTGADLANGAVVPALTSTLRSSPEYNYLVLDYAGSAQGIDASLASAGITSVKVIGTGLDQNSLASIKAGTQHAWVAQSWFQEGYAMADVALRLETGSDGIENTATPAIQLITADNAADVNGPNDEWNQPADALEEFQTLWNVG